MKRSLFTLSLALFGIILYSQSSPAKFNIIPEPVATVEKSGNFTLPKSVNILRPAGSENDITVNFLKEKLSKATGSRVTVKSSGKSDIQLVLNAIADPMIGNEGYILSVRPKKITIRANKPAGLFYGAQTLIQLFPPQIESPTKVINVAWKIPAVEIGDYPRVGWRGLMLDVARHFFTVDEVKQYIDAMVRYKYNMLHWHLTDDEGWRIEIKSLPKLTETGAWRVEKVGNFGEFSPALPDEPKTYGGFYTQDQIRDLVNYAAERFVQVIPEIDMPGHARAANRAYPQFSGGGSARYPEFTFDPGNEKTYQYLTDILKEPKP